MTASEPTTADLFALVWDDLADVLGSSATASLLRRAAKHAGTREPALSALVIQRAAFEYEYTVPAAWREHRGSCDELALLVQALLPLLEQLTGSIVIRRLQAIPALVRAGLIEREEGRP